MFLHWDLAPFLGLPRSYFHGPCHCGRQHCGELLDPLRECHVCGLKAKPSCFEGTKKDLDFPSLSVVEETLLDGQIAHQNEKIAIWQLFSANINAQSVEPSRFSQGPKLIGSE